MDWVKLDRGNLVVDAIFKTIGRRYQKSHDAPILGLALKETGIAISLESLERHAQLFMSR
jgi:hypothetical protein